MSELIDVQEPNDRVYTMSPAGEIRVYVVQADGTLKEEPK